jgi:SAM-dependent methyltransferase
MTDWTSGYVADIGYTYGYYLELNPQRVKLAFLNAGLVAPEFGTACELGFGQGLSANMHAAASVCSWHGTDFNPAQAGFAQELASVSGANAHLFDEAFTDFAQRDMPEFDYIGLHGIWSWISDENRAVIVDFIRKKLKVGGVLYISYNTLPGWGTFAPMRHLMTEHAEIIGADGVGIVSRIDGALDFTEKLLATNPLFARANPLIAERINRIKDQNRTYLAHEYFNRDWQPMHFGTMAKWLESAKLTYACSAHYLDHVDVVNLTAEQQAFLKDIYDPMFKQTVRDFMVNQQFRKDYWVKGARRLTTLDQAQGLRDQRLILTTHRPDVSLKVTGDLGEAVLTETIYAPILDLMADHKIRTLAEIEQAVKDAGITFAQLIQAVLVLCGNGTFSAAQDDTAITKAKKHTDKLNTHLMLKTRSSNDITYLASPVTGGGVMLGRFQQLFVLALQQGKKMPEDWAAFVDQILVSQGQKIVIEGKPLETTAQQLAELTRQATEFANKVLPIMKALQIV